MMSGRRNAPPISISSPRETMASLAGAERVQHQQHRGGVVVDDRRGLGAGQLAQTRPRTWSSRSPRPPPPRSNSSATAERMASTAAAIALLGQHGAAEIGVQHRAGEVEDAAAGSARPRAPAAAAASAAIGVRIRLGSRAPHARPRAGGEQRPPHGADRGLVPETRGRGSAPTSVRSTWSTEGSLVWPTGRVSFMCGPAMSVAQQEGFWPPRFQPSRGHQHVEPSVATSSASGSSTGSLTW